MAAPIPLMLFGKSPAHQKACQEIVRPEYKIVSTVSSLADGRSILASHLAQRSIRVVAMGGGFTNEDMDAMRAVEGSETVAWLRPVHTRPGAEPVKFDGSGPPSAELIAGRLRRALDEHGAELREGRGAGETWYF